MQATGRTHRFLAILARAMLGLAAAAAICAPVRADVMVTGGKTGTYYQIGLNLKEIVAPNLEIQDSTGSWANVEELSQTEGVSLAIVQSDVYNAFVNMRDNREVPEATRREYARLLANLRVFMPLY